jgi:hypothetical protein
MVPPTVDQHNLQHLKHTRRRHWPGRCPKWPPIPSLADCRYRWRLRGAQQDRGRRLIGSGGISTVDAIVIDGGPFSVTREGGAANGARPPVNCQSANDSIVLENGSFSAPISALAMATTASQLLRSFRSRTASSISPWTAVHSQGAGSHDRRGGCIVRPQHGRRAERLWRSLQGE